MAKAKGKGKAKAKGKGKGTSKARLRGIMKHAAKLVKSGSPQGAALRAAWKAVKK